MGGVCCAKRDHEHEFMENGVEGNGWYHINGFSHYPH